MSPVPMSRRAAAVVRLGSRPSTTGLAMHIRKLVSGVAASALVALATGVVGAQGLQGLDETCTVSVNGRTAFVRADGSFRIANLPAAGDLVRAEVTCIRSGQTFFGTSELFQVLNAQTFVLGDIALQPVLPPQLVDISAAPDNALLTSPMQTTQVRANANYSDGSSNDITPRTTGTTYLTSNPFVVTVSPDGLATARGQGTALVTVRNLGRTAVTRIDVDLGDPLTTVVGFVEDDNGNPVSGASVQIVGQAANGSTNAIGQFTLAGVLSRSGPLRFSATANVGGRNLTGSGGPVEPVPGDLTDGGRVKVREISEVVVVHGGSALPCLAAGASSISMVVPSTATVRSTTPMTQEAFDVATTGDGRTAVVVGQCPGAGNLDFFDLTTDPPALIGSIPAPLRGASIEITPSGIALLTNGTTAIASVDVATRGVVQTLTMPQVAGSLALTRDGAFGIVAGSGSNNLRVISISPTGVLADTGQSVGNGATASPVNLRVSPDGSEALCCNLDGTVSVFDVNGATGQIARRGTPIVVRVLPLQSPHSVQWHPDGTRAFVLNGDILGFTPREVVQLNRDGGGNFTVGVRAGGLSPGNSASKNTMAIVDDGRRLLVIGDNQTYLFTTSPLAVSGLLPTAGQGRGIRKRGL